jgi:serine/threonine-protein kinase
MKNREGESYSIRSLETAPATPVSPPHAQPAVAGERTIGPYRVLRPLGRGGMGEVLLAEDPRLGRRVAIKRVRPERSGDPARRARLLAEARLAARLQHPSVVQVFDLLAEGDEAFLVLEYVPGPTLHERLAAGPLSPAEGLPIAAAIAEGLAHAHLHGVLHRDLKAENVLLPPGGGAKIADFGIARWLDPEGDGTARVATRDGWVAGTARSMSPEQVAGDPLDERSDLFSLGTLLYESFTGRSPFLAASECETLHRVISHRPEEPSDLVPELPPALSRLTAQLLEKDPLLRPGSAAEVAGRLRSLSGERPVDGTTRYQRPAPGAAATPAAGAVNEASAAGAAAVGATGARAPDAPAPQWSRQRIAAAAVIPVVAVALALAVALRPAPPPRSVAVLPVEVGPIAPEEADPAGGSDELLAFALRTAAMRTLVSLAGVTPIAPAEVDAVPGPPSAVARAVAADELVTLELTCPGAECTVAVSRVRAADGAVLWSDQIQVPRDLPLTSARSLEPRLREGFAELPRRPGRPDPRIGEADYAEYLEIRRSHHADPRAGGQEALLDRLEALRRRSPGFADAELLEAEIAARLYAATRDPALLERALERVASAERTAPGDPEALLQRLYVETVAGRLDDAETTLGRIERLAPGDVRVISGRARLAAQRGEPAAALELYRAAAERSPSWPRLYNLAAFAYRQGEVGTARGALGRLLDRFPEHFEGLSLAATIELVNGDLGRAVELYERLVALQPRPWELSNLGLAHLLSGDADAAAGAFARAVEAAPDNPVWTLNLADARQLQARRAEADALYLRVLELTEPGGAATGGGERDAASWTIRAQALAHLGRPREAVAAVHEALRLAPDDGEVAFGAALVHTLAGDLTAARVHGKRALGLGYRARWFELPWFEPLGELRGPAGPGV